MLLLKIYANRTKILIFCQNVVYKAILGCFLELFIIKQFSGKGASHSHGPQKTASLGPFPWPGSRDTWLRLHETASRHPPRSAPGDSVCFQLSSSQFWKRYHSARASKEENKNNEIGASTLKHTQRSLYSINRGRKNKNTNSA